MSDLANKNPAHPAKSEFPVNNECCVGYTHIKILIVACLKFEFNLAFCILPANPTPKAKNCATSFPRRLPGPSHSPPQTFRTGHFRSGGCGGRRRSGPTHRRKPSRPGPAPGPASRRWGPPAAVAGRRAGGTAFPPPGGGKQSKQEIHRRSARLRNTKYKSAPAAEKKVSTKGKGRRHIFKLKNPIKAPESVSTIITAESIFYKGVYYQIGDVVSVIDEQDGKPYYAQIRGFIQDQYCEKSAALTWLIPTLSSPRDQFDPASYIIGPEEDLPRKMEYLEFVCHAPSEYFKSRSSPFPTVPTRPEKGYIWTHVGPTPAITIKETVANHL
uniref:GATA zinc finger domain containing 1 n=1 Tax=Mustela putorius furo TaxID=9669 RepID=M3YAI2_MUSPF